MNVKTRKNVADDFKLAISNCTDEELFHFGLAVYSGEAKSLAFESASEFIKRTAKESIDSMPF